MFYLKKSNKKVFLPSLFLFIGSLSLFGCNSNNDNTGYDGKVFDVSKNNDNSLQLKVEYIKDIKSGSYYNLTLEGNGVSKDFENKKTPWQAISKKVKNVEIKEGVTSLGNNFFNTLNLNYFILPESLNTISNTSFNEGATLYLKNATCELNNVSNEYFLFSESKPLENEEKYWHFVNSLPVLWENIKVLFIGNSFTFYHDVPSLTEEIAKSIGFNFTSDAITRGSWTLTKFADPNDEEGQKVYEKLTSTNDYDYVILQDQSTRSYTKYTDFYKAVNTLNNLVKTTQKDCEVRLYSTWGYEEGAQVLKCSIPEMEDKIKEKYDQCANSLNLKVHYVGSAFSKVYEENNEIPLYYKDNKHQSYFGSFLSAHVHVMSLLNIDSRSSTFSSYHSNEENKDWTIEETIADVLKNAAYNICF